MFAHWSWRSIKRSKLYLSALCKGVDELNYDKYPKLFECIRAVLAIQV